MRDFKTRVWNKMFKNMDYDDKDWIIRNINNNPEMMQYTGLKDKNNKSIYEGDIVEYAGKKAEVVFHEGAFELRPERFGESIRHSDQIEVIGNIYEPKS